MKRYNIRRYRPLLLALSLSLAACNGGDGPSTTDATQNFDPLNLASGVHPYAFQSDEELAIAVNAAISNVSNSYDYIYKASAPTAVEAADNASAGGVSQTNLQVSGVDEADLIKSDGSTLFLATQPESYNPVEPVILGASSGTRNNRLRSFRLDDASATASLIYEGSLFEGNNVSTRGIYLSNSANGETLTALGGSDWYYDWWGYTGYWSDGATVVETRDVTNPGSPSLLHTITLDGYLISSRLIGNTLYLVTRYSAKSTIYPVTTVIDAKKTTDDTAQAQAQALSYDELIPNVSIDGGTPAPLVHGSDCYLPAISDLSQFQPTLLTISAIDLDNPTALKSQCLLGDAGTVYVSSNALYLANQRWTSNTASGAYETHTVIHRFNLDNRGPMLTASGQVPGVISGSQDSRPFRLAQLGDALAVVTHDDTADTVTSPELGRITAVSNSAPGPGLLTILEADPKDTQTLVQVAGLSGLGKAGEQIYATRYVDNRLYLVTFRLTDPLYAIDLSDPHNPTLLGELEIPGYSDYLHPLPNGLLLGLGKEAVTTNTADGDLNRGAWYQGVKLSLFDINNPQNITELSTVVLGERGTDSAALHDHHAFTYLPANGEHAARIALPVRLHDTPSLYATGEPWDYYDWTSTGLHLFAIDESGHKPALVKQGSLITSSAANGDAENMATTNDRALLGANAVFYLHNGQLWSAPWNNPGAMAGPQ